MPQEPLAASASTTADGMTGAAMTAVSVAPFTSSTILARSGARSGLTIGATVMAPPVSVLVGATGGACGSTAAAEADKTAATPPAS